MAQKTSKNLLGQKGRCGGMKISQFVITILLFFLLITPANAQGFVKPEDVSFDIIPKILCTIFPGCSEDGNRIPTPTPDPNDPVITPTAGPAPTGLPYPTTNPSITPPPGTCMPPGGPITCGSRNVPIRYNGKLCGHCGVGYTKTSYCDDFRFTPPRPKKDTNGNAEAIDIGHLKLDSVPLPFLNGYNVSWYHSGEGSYRGDPSAWQEYDGISDDKKTYKIRYLHTQPGSGAPLNTKADSGQEGAKVAKLWLRADGAQIDGNHIHIQIYDTKVNNWVDAPNFYCHN